MTTERFCVRNVRYDDLSVICALEEQCFAVAWTMDDFELFCGEALCEASDVSRSLFLVCTDCNACNVNITVGHSDKTEVFLLNSLTCSSKFSNSTCRCSF